MEDKLKTAIKQIGENSGLTEEQINTLFLDTDSFIDSWFEARGL